MKLVAACAFGLEAIVKRELIALGHQDAKVEQPGRIAFEGDWAAVARANLWLRVADRILIEVQRFAAPDFDALFETVKAFDWSHHLPVDANFPVNGRSRLSQLTSVPAVQRSVKRALVESLLRTHATDTLDESGSLYKIEVALLKDEAAITIDTTGDSLHKRGYRMLTGNAPIKETLGAAMVDLSVWKPSRPLVDPFCGTGTIPIEAALIGMNIAPGINRDFSFGAWSVVPEGCLDSAREEARALERRDTELQITGTDRDEAALEMARFHAKKAGVADKIHFQQKSFDDFRTKREYGCIITNPPYGERLEDTRKLLPLYKSIPMVVQRMPTWSLFVITNMPGFQGLVQKSATRRRKLFNGRIECIYYQYLGPRPPRDGIGAVDTSEPIIDDSPVEAGSEDVVNESAVNEDAIDRSSPDSDPIVEASVEPSVEAKRKPEAQPVFGGLQPKDHEQAELFRSRLLKRARHLRRWPARRDIHCFRLYERDIPEIPLVVDRYGDSLHIAQYERPSDRDLARDAAWLDLMKKTAASALDIPIKRVHSKRRLKDQQYQRMDTQGKLMEVTECGLKFLVNLVDYVDTGLFLDHRSLRNKVRELSEGKDFLNLFAYTGSFSVYAAAGGAKSTTTVDLSSNYLEWAERNMQVNGFGDSAKHQFFPADTMSFLNEIARSPQQRFDLAVVDPPTFSNSKRTGVDDWDVQQDHVELLRRVRLVMRDGGTVFFSTNFRRFKLDEAAIEGFSIREITTQTIPEDFRNKRIHRCWQMKCV